MRVKGYTIAPFDKKMERRNGAWGRHFDGKDERTLLQNAKCKGVRVERRVTLERYAERRMLSNVVQMQRSESRASSLARTLCRATHAFDEVKCKNRGEN